MPREDVLGGASQALWLILPRCLAQAHSCTAWGFPDAVISRRIDKESLDALITPHADHG